MSMTDTKIYEVLSLSPTWDGAEPSARIQFCHAMKGRHYNGLEPLSDSWEWFVKGWSAALLGEHL